MAANIVESFGKRDYQCTPLGDTVFTSYCSGGSTTVETVCCADTTQTFPQCLSYSIEQESVSWCCMGSSDSDDCYAFFDPTFWQQSPNATSCASVNTTGDVVAWCPSDTSCMETWSSPLDLDELVSCQLPQGVLKSLNTSISSSNLTTSSMPSVTFSSASGNGLMASTDSATTSLVSITTLLSPSPTSTMRESGSGSSLVSPDALAGIILGSILSAALFGVLVFWLFWRRLKDRFAAHRRGNSNSAAPGTEIGPAGFNVVLQQPISVWSDNRCVEKMDDQQKHS